MEQIETILITKTELNKFFVQVRILGIYKTDIYGNDLKIFYYMPDYKELITQNSLN